MDKYGPFADVVGIALALVATFSLLLLKSLGKLNNWTWLAGKSPSFLITGGARGLAVAVMALTYALIDRGNYGWFAGGAVLCGTLLFFGAVRLNRLHTIHVATIPLVGRDGQQLVDKKGSPRFEAVVIGTEGDMRTEAAKDLGKARKKKGGLSLVQFMSGYGAQKVNDPDALWDKPVLAAAGTRLTVTLMSIVLFAVLALFLAAFVVVVATRQP